MTWQDIEEMAYAECRIDTAVHWITPQQVMTWLSEARHKYQEATNRLRRELAITLDPNSVDGSYDFPPDYKESYMVTYRATNTPDFIPVERTSYDMFARIQHRDTVSQSPVSVMTLPQSGSCIWIAENLGKFWIYPYRGAQGIVTVGYFPTCSPYSTSDTVNWPGYGLDPEPAMAANGPEREFRSAIEGFKGYLVYKIMMKKPNRTSADLAQAQDAYNEFLRGEEALRRTNVDYVNQMQTPFYLGPVF